MDSFEILLLEELLNKLIKNSDLGINYKQVSILELLTAIELAQGLVE